MTAIAELGGRPVRPMTGREMGVVAALSAWAIAGLALDGRAHQDNAVESFFTIWHAILYTGIAASGAWVALKAREAAASGRQLDGFRLTVAGLVLLGAGGPADLLWHTAFGIEADVAALLSPTHLLLMAGGVLLLSAPLRGAWRSAPATGPAPLGAVVSLAMVTAIVAFFFQYASPLHEVDAFRAAEPEPELGLAGLALTNLILVAPLIVLTRRFGTPARGTVTLLLGLPSAMVAVSGDLAVPEALAGALLAGLAGDGLAAALRPGPQRPAAFWAFGALVPAVLWSAVLAALALGDGGLTWPVELWSGSILLAAAAGYGVALTALPPHSSPATDDGQPALEPSSASSSGQNVLRAAGVSSTGA